MSRSTKLSISLPGSNIISTWNNNRTESLSETFMAALHVAGYVVYLITLVSSLTPATVALIIKSHSLKNVLSGIPKSINGSTFISVIQNSLFLSIAAGTTNASLNSGLQKSTFFWCSLDGGLQSQSGNSLILSTYLLYLSALHVGDKIYCL